MSLDRKTIKKIGKENMKKQWGELLLALVLFLTVDIVVSLFTLGVGGFVIMGPMVYALTYMYYHSSKDEKINQKMLLIGFKEKFGDSFLAQILVLFAQVIPVLIVMIVASIVMRATMGPSFGGMGMAGGYTAVGMGGGGTAGRIIVVILMILAIIVGLYIYYGLCLTVYILMREPGKTAVQAIKKSWAMMKGQALRVFIFDLTFIGWFILSFFVGVLWIWVAPYYYSSKMVLFNDIYENSNVEDEPEFSFKSEFGDIKSGMGGIKDKVSGAVKKDTTDETASVESAKTAEAESTAADAAENASPKAEAGVKTCGNCGATIRATAKFCNKCGKPV
ncbi:MAG: DUF975 family protein [Firmicutes bacterium]|nr:DUF975 family protein [Bacillota bacterium]